MTEPLSIAGGSEPGRQGVAAFPFYTGAVGIRERDGWLDVAFFAPEVRARLPAIGFLDGVKVRIASVAARQIDPSARPRGAMCAITATVIPEDS
ncbi:hypothetical protein [Sphingomonas abaci]|uniref:Uncharacterized protein n=1 Tax=Sphingomonas abaci TaxID=237611 RepID=A0A7W7EZN0_9SPHN|nr:hypothetical protein [Sphingomonas abaci]MBB4619983.1 hypothetical protein [Sphingomonas abaci]